MKLVFLLLVLSTMLLPSCASVKPKPPAEILKVLSIKPQVSMPVEPEMLHKSSAIVAQQVFILLSSDSPSNQKLADILQLALAGHATQLLLTGSRGSDRAKIKEIKSSASSQVVAIGQKALMALQSIADKQVVFSQVINAEDYIKENIKGVSALPSPEKLFFDWKSISPKITKVAVIVGSNLDAYLQRAKQAAARQGINLMIKIVKNDKEFIYASKNLKLDVDGQWIIPDSRVLSGKALKEVMAFGSRRGRQVVVFSPRLLSFGALFYVSPDMHEISNGILLRLKQSRHASAMVVAGVLPIMNHTIGINLNIARQLNLVIPKDYLKYTHGTDSKGN